MYIFGVRKIEDIDKLDPECLFFGKGHKATSEDIEWLLGDSYYYHTIIKMPDDYIPRLFEFDKYEEYKKEVRKIGYEILKYIGAMDLGCYDNLDSIGYSELFNTFFVDDIQAINTYLNIDITEKDIMRALNVSFIQEKEAADILNEMGIMEFTEVYDDLPFKDVI